MPQNTFTTSQGIVFIFENGFLAEIIDAGIPGSSRNSIDANHLLTTAGMEFLAAALVDYGELSVTMNFKPNLDPPIDQPASTVVIKFTQLTPQITWTFEGFMTAYNPVATTNDKMTATATIKVSGKIDVGNAASTS